MIGPGLALSVEQLGVGSEAREVERGRVRLAVNEQEIRLEVAVAVALPLAGERMVSTCGRERHVRCQPGHYLGQERIEAGAGAVLFFRACSPAGRRSSA